MDCCICGKEIRDGDAIACLGAGKTAHARCADEGLRKAVWDKWRVEQAATALQKSEAN